MATVQDVLRVAGVEVGTVEGPRTNEVKYNRWYYGRTVYGRGYPWCATFVSWVMTTANVGTFARNASVLGFIAAFRQRGQWHAGVAGIAPGDVICFEFRTGHHTGIVEKVGRFGVLTIEGNTDEAGGRTGGRVMRKDRPYSTHTILGYGRPAYAATNQHPQEDEVTEATGQAILAELRNIKTELNTGVGPVGGVVAAMSARLGRQGLDMGWLKDAITALATKAGVPLRPRP